MKRIEILDKGNTKYRLTVTPSRITIKIKENSDMVEQNHIVDFLKRVANKLQDTQVSLRGNVLISQLGLSICMQSDRKNVTLNFNEQEL